MAWLALGTAALLLLLLLARVFADAKVSTIKTGLAWVAGLGGAALLVALLIGGRGAQALWALALFGPLLWRWWQGVRAARSFSRGGRASPGGTSDVETATLALSLDHDTGRMMGRVKRGRFAGADLADLDLPQLLDLLADCRAEDAESVPLLEAWLDRAAPDWRAAEAAAGPGGWGAEGGGGHAGAGAAAGGRMTRDEALAVLGLQDGATEAEIRAAHRRLMRAAHPDQGGSVWLAARLNEARDVLLPR